MTSVADFIKLPKKDFHSSLDLGMRYPSFVTWAGFYVPDFPEDGSPVKIEMRSQVHEYTSMRIATEDDIKKTSVPFNFRKPCRQHNSDKRSNRQQAFSKLRKKL